MPHGRSRQEVLKDNSGLSTSIIEALGGISLKVIGISVGSGLLAILLGFWVVAASSADTSSGYQSANIAFDKAVKASDVVIGGEGNRVGLLSDTTLGDCEVQTWQGGTRDGITTLHVDTKTVPGVCTATTPLIALGAGEHSQELLFNVAAPSFSYSNLGGRVITFDAAGVSTLATGTKPEGAKVADWDDVRPYSVKLNLMTLNEKTAKVTEKAELSGVTNVVNVSVTEDDLRYVPAPNTDPVPGPLRIASVDRSTTTGAVQGGVREGVSVSVSGGVCPSMPTKLTASYAQQSPGTVAAVTTSTSKTLTGAATTLDLGSVANGSSGAVEVSAQCIDNGVTEKANTGYTQPLPAAVLTAKQGATAEKHDLSWPKVSSLPTRFDLAWVSTNKAEGTQIINDGFSATVTQSLGTTYGFTTNYSLIATVNGVVSPKSTASLNNAWPAVAKPTILKDDGWTSGNKDKVRWYWADAVCPAGTVADYASAYWRHDTGLSGWRSFVATTYYDVSTAYQGYDYRVDVQTRCRSTVTGSTSAIVTSTGPQFTRVVENAAPINWQWAQSGDRTLYVTPQTTCSGGATLYQWLVEASWDVIWIGGPANGKTGWYQPQPGWYQWGPGISYSTIWNVYSAIPNGSRYQVRVLSECQVIPTGRNSSRVQSDSPIITWWR